MNIRIHLFLLMIAVLLSAAVFAQEDSTTGEAVPPEGETPAGEFLSTVYSQEEIRQAYMTAEAVRGVPVRDADGQLVGNVEDLVLDLNAGFIPYYVFSYTSPETQEERLLPMPADFFFYNPGQQSFTLNTGDVALLENAPSYDELILGGREEGDFGIFWNRALFSYWTNAGTVFPEWRAPQTTLGGVPGYNYAYGGGMTVFPRSLTSLDVISSYTVRTAEGEAVGDIQDFLMNSITSEISAVILETGSGKKAVPLMAFTMNPAEESVIYDLSPGLLADAAVLEGLSLSGGGESAGTVAGELDAYWQSAASEFRLRVGMRVIPQKIMQASDLEEFTVVNTRRQVLGELTDFVLDDQGAVPYAIIEFGEVLGFGGRWTAVPLAALSIDPVNQVAVFPLDADALQGIPSFEEESLPAVLEAGWNQGVETFWRRLAGKESADEDAQSSAGLLLSRVSEFPVVNPGGDEVGEVEAAMLDLQNGEVPYFVLSSNGFLGIGDKLFAVPPTAFGVMPEENAFLLDVSRETLEKAPGIGDEPWPDTANPRWDREIRDFWNGRED